MSFAPVLAVIALLIAVAALGGLTGPATAVQLIGLAAILLALAILLAVWKL